MRLGRANRLIFGVNHRHGRLDVLQREMILIRVALLELCTIERTLEVDQQPLKQDDVVFLAFDDCIAICKALVLCAKLLARCNQSIALSASISSGRSAGKDMGVCYQKLASIACENRRPSHSAAAGGWASKAVTRRQSRPANSASNCARSSRKTPSRIAGHLNAFCSRRL